MIFPIVFLLFEFNGVIYNEVEYPITPENYQEYRDQIPERIYESYCLALSMPSILQPCESTIWYQGDSMVVFWQGASLDFNRTSTSQIFDSLYVTMPLPTWYYNMELYKDGVYIETLSPPNHRHHTEPLNIDSLSRSGGSYCVKNYPTEEVGCSIENIASGSAYQIRMLLWNWTDSRGNVDACQCLELWSDSFSISEPWLEILEPNETTIWHEDSSDVYIEFLAHGRFGREPFESITPRIHLLQGDREIEPFRQISGSFSHSILRSSSPVSPEWGNGSRFRISLEIDGEDFHSDYFSIYGQTIKILSPEVSLLPLGSPLLVEWCSSGDFSYSLHLFGRQIHPRPSSGEIVSIGLYRVNEISEMESSPLILMSNIRNDGDFVYGKPFDKEWIGETIRLKINDCDGNYGWSRQFILGQQQGGLYNR